MTGSSEVTQPHASDCIDVIGHVDPEDVLTQLVDEVFRLSAALAAAGDELTAASGLTAARWLVLGALADEPLTIAQVATRRGLRRQSARESVQRLERDGLVSRAPHLTDARTALLHLTPRGRRALADIEPRRRAWSPRTAAALSPRDARTALATVRHLRKHLHAGVQL